VRRLVERTLGPVADALFDALEQRVTANHHRRAAEVALDRVGAGLVEGSLSAAVFEALASQVRAEIGGTALPAATNGGLASRAQSAVERSVDWEGPFESGEVAAAIHWIALLPDAVGVAPACPWLRSECGPAVADAVPDPRRLARLDAALAAGAGVAEAAPVLQAHAFALEPRGWFLLKGTGYGTAHLLRALLRTVRASPDHPLASYTREVCDRLIRHVEVRRLQSLAFRREALPVGADPRAERSRFALALVEATETFGDLRYLNTALKLNDWQLRHQRRRAASATARLHYAVAIGRQERAMREVLGE
jgi:hypothetical protein